VGPDRLRHRAAVPAAARLCRGLARHLGAAVLDLAEAAVRLRRPAAAADTLSAGAARACGIRSVRRDPVRAGLAHPGTDGSIAHRHPRAAARLVRGHRAADDPGGPRRDGAVRPARRLKECAMTIRSTLDYLLALARLNLRSGLAPPRIALLSALLMFGNNVIFFAIWTIYFANFSSLRGWTLADMAMLMGMCEWAFGLTVVLAGGVRHMAQTIVDGGLDLHRGRPRHPLPSLLMSRSLPSGLGDLASAPVFWLVFAGRPVADLPLLVLVATAAGVVLTATVAL